MRAHMVIACGVVLVLIACSKGTPSQSTPVPSAAVVAARLASEGGNGASIVAQNDTSRDAVVTIVFGSDTVVKGWPFCKASGPTCSFMLGSKASRVLPLEGQYLNATLVFDGHPDGSLCGSTKVEVNVNNPKWYDILDVSLVDGYSNKVEIVALEPGGTSTRLGPAAGKGGNEKVYGLFPYGCDICTARQSPPCGIPAGGPGCKGGSQYKPDVPCQYQGSVMAGGTSATVRLLPP